MKTIEFIGYDTGGNIKTNIDGLLYKFATTEFYGGMAIYGVAFPNDNHYTFFSRSKRAEKIYFRFADKITDYIKNNPFQD